MPMRTIRGSDEQYALVLFDAAGDERADGGEALSAKLLGTDPSPTDIFLEIHGWKGDVPGAIEQYDRWFAALAAQTSDRAAMARAIGEAGGGVFRPLWIGLHWPSLPWGDEDVPAMASFGIASIAPVIDDYVARLGDRPGLREAISVIVEHAQFDAAPAVLPESVRAAYEQIDLLMDELAADGPAGAPGTDNPPFDAEAIYQEVRAGGAAFGGFDLGGLLAPLRQLSFWKMKERARRVGETGFHELIAAMIARFPGVRIHLMGHSFGCVVASAAVAGPADGAGNAIASLALVLGAVSLWAYGPGTPFGDGPGYFERMLAQSMVAGPIVATISRHDRALGTYYPIGAGIAGQVSFGIALPRFGALGTFGAQGIANAVSFAIADENTVYPLVPGKLHNVEASAVIRRADRPGGAHSDIDGPEVAHLIWAAAIASVQR